MVEGLKGQILEELLESLGPFSLEKKRLRGDLFPVCNFPNKGQRRVRCWCSFSAYQ